MASILAGMATVLRDAKAEEVLKQIEALRAKLTGTDQEPEREEIEILPPPQMIAGEALAVVTLNQAQHELAKLQAAVERQGIRSPAEVTDLQVPGGLFVKCVLYEQSQFVGVDDAQQVEPEANHAGHCFTNSHAASSP